MIALKEEAALILVDRTFGLSTLSKHVAFRGASSVSQERSPVAGK